MAMASTPKVPDIVIGRLPIYLRALNVLARQGKDIVLSQELADRLGGSSALIRKDLAYFGEFGKQGTGYQVAYLQAQLRRILKVEGRWKMVLVGAGDLGHALVHYGEFENNGFGIVAVFDNDPHKIGRRMGELQVLDGKQLLPHLISHEGIRIAIIATPADAAQEVADTLVQADVRAILNYAPITIQVPPGVRVQYIDPVVHLQSMSYYLEPSG
jgi:redox-sensing transcriptional repressor